MPIHGVLHVEHHDAVAFLFACAAKEATNGLELHRVADGDQALSFLRRKTPYEGVPRPDLIVLDINLPSKNGLAVLAELKADESTRSTPVTMFTTSALDRDRDASLACGAQQFFTKPTTLKRFVELVRLALHAD